MSNAGFEHLDWDSSFFEMKIGRALSRTFDKNDRSVIEDAKRSGLNCLYFLVEAESIATLDAMQAFGCKYVDGRLCFSLTEPAVSAISADGIGIESAQIGDGVELAKISESIEWSTRFLKDSGFPISRSRRMYSVWVQKDLENRSVLIARGRARDQILGFLSYRVDASERKASIQLLGVRPEARGRGIADGLISSAIENFGEAGVEEVEVVTQSSNIPAQRLYQKYGFRSSSLNLWFHLWL